MQIINKSSLVNKLLHGRYFDTKIAKFIKLTYLRFLLLIPTAYLFHSVYCLCYFKFYDLHIM